MGICSYILYGDFSHNTFCMGFLQLCVRFCTKKIYLLDARIGHRCPIEGFFHSKFCIFPSKSPPLRPPAAAHAPRAWLSIALLASFKLVVTAPGDPPSCRPFAPSGPSEARPHRCACSLGCGRASGRASQACPPSFHSFQKGGSRNNSIVPAKGRGMWDETADQMIGCDAVQYN